ncbi:MAG: hypothetical protein IJY92_07275 [Alphaproteobacteria bacterium]|nr:hypothetical protein [Alphaproteobacteria bacterium]
MDTSKTLSQNAQEIADVSSYRATFEMDSQVFSNGVIAAKEGYGQRIAGFSDIVKANNSLPPTPEHGMDR